MADSIPPEELANWATVIISKGRGATAQHLLAGHLGPRKNNRRVYAHPDGQVVGEYRVSELRSRGLAYLVMAYRRSDLEYEPPTSDQLARKYRGG